jgi:hypothetical protein
MGDWMALVYWALGFVGGVGASLMWWASRELKRLQEADRDG